MAQRVDIEWRKGDDGLGGTYQFDPRPNITKEGTVQKIVEFKIPLRDGNLVQLLNNDSKRFVLRGYFCAPNGDYDTLEDSRRSLESGLGNGPGQLHIISNLGNPNSRHLYWRAIPARIGYREQRNSKILEYEIELLLTDPTENVV